LNETLRSNIILKPIIKTIYFDCASFSHFVYPTTFAAVIEIAIKQITSEEKSNLNTAKVANINLQLEIQIDSLL
jgi:hypothetical protein